MAMTHSDDAIGQQTLRVRIVVDFNQFYTHNYRRTLALAYAVTGDRGHAEDLTQDAFAAAHRRWATLATYEDPSSWVRRIVLNKASTRWRRIGRELRALTSISHRSPEAMPDLAAVDARFWVAVGSLPTQQARAIALFYLHDLPLAAVAQELGCSEGSAKTHLSRARTALFSQLKDHR